MRGGVTGSKFVLSIKNSVRELKKFAYRRANEISWSGQWKNVLFSNPKRDVCECGGNNIKLSECRRDISRHVQAYGLDINRVEMDLILCRAGK